MIHTDQHKKAMYIIFFRFLKHKSGDKSLSNFTQWTGLSVLLNLWPLLKIEPIAENSAFLYIKNIRQCDNPFFNRYSCKINEIFFETNSFMKHLLIIHLKKIGNFFVK